MEASNVAVGLVLLSQTVFGVLGNSSLLYHYAWLYFTGFRLRSTDFILQHLIVANFLTLLSKGVPQAMTAFGLKVFPSDWECKLFSYLYRVSQGMSVYSTCLLSAIQAITISPRVSWWAKPKAKPSMYIGSSIYLGWILYLLGNIGILQNMTASRANKNMTGLKGYGSCASVWLDRTTEILIATFMSFPDVVCMGIMLWASSSIVLLLYRHKWRMQHMLRTTVCPRSSPESRATKTVLLLVGTFVLFFALSCICQVFLLLTYNPSMFLLSIVVVVAECFPTVSPFLLLSLMPINRASALQR